jgi:hypothetical protein
MGPQEQNMGGVVTEELGRGATKRAAQHTTEQQLCRQQLILERKEKERTGEREGGAGDKERWSV